MTQFYRIRDWQKFQHYRERNPPWIKFHVEILASEEWVTLNDSGKLLAVVCMVVAAREHGRIPANPAFLRRVAYLDATPDLGPLIQCGFLEPIADANESGAPQADGDTALAEASPAPAEISPALADGDTMLAESGTMLADARPEKEKEAEAEKEKKILSDPPAADADLAVSSQKGGRKKYPEAFEAFWRDYPTDPVMSKLKAFQQWRHISPEDRAAAMRALPGFRVYCGKHPLYRPVHAERFLAQRRFDGFNDLDDRQRAQAPGAGDLGREWGGKAEALVAAIGAAKFQAWFSGSRFAAGPPVTITVEKPFAADWIERHFIGDLRRIFGDVEVKHG